MAKTKVVCSTPAKKPLPTDIGDGDPTLLDATRGISGGYPIGIFAKDHQLAVPNELVGEPEEGSHADGNGGND